MRPNRLFVALLCLIMALSILLCSCNNTPGSTQDDTTPADPDTTTAAPADTTPVDVPTSVTLFEGGQAKFRLIRSDQASEQETNAALTIRKALLAIFPGASFEFTSDFSKDGTYDSNTVEILVGRTKYPECLSVLNSISYGDYTVQVVGNKVVVTAWQDSCMSVLANKFSDILTSALSADKQSLTLTENHELTKTITPVLSMAPVCTIKAPDRVVNAGDQAYQLLMTNTGDEVYKSYTKTLTDNGFKEQSNRVANNNLLGVYTNDEAAITVYHTPQSKSTRIIIEPVENYYFSSAESFTAVTTPKLTMIGRKCSSNSTYLGISNNYGLMCFLIRLSDGRFVVVDGGVSDNANGSYAQALYSCMMEQAVDKNNITIAAWIITHSHSDHIGGFCSFAASYSKYVKLESLLLNFPSDADAEAASDEKGSYAKFRTHAQSYYKSTPMYKVHTGQIYTIADATIEIFYTHEDFVTMSRTVASTTNWNNSSIIFGFGIAGQKIMFLGDSQEIPNNQTANIFGSCLKSDFVQVAHHGGLGGTNAIYKAVDPTIALFTTTDEIIPTYMEKFTANYYLVNDLNVVEYYNSHDRIHTWDLPYTPTASGFIK